MSMMKKTAMAVALGLVSASAFADTAVRARGGYMFGDYELSVDDGSSYTADYTGVPLGLTFVFDNNMYLDVLMANVSGDANVGGYTTDFDRDDITLSLGWRMDNLSLYVGYKDASTVTQFPLGLPADEFDSSGFVGGLGYIIPNGNHAFGMNLGIGLLEGTYSPAPGESYDADYTFGFSFGLSYTYVFSKQFNITADYKWQSYDFEFSDYNTTLTEEFSGFGVVAGYTF